jgi:hypothetical protein
MSVLFPERIKHFEIVPGSKGKGKVRDLGVLK